MTSRVRPFIPVEQHRPRRVHRPWYRDRLMVAVVWMLGASIGMLAGTALGAIA